ncbi:hypothetical protein EZS27_009223 [termite gut metagenome]|uniref:Transmembrane protein EpsG n=1 Tax=termite gut metagenome TaxID=433724 RepID=A0A5J4SCU0_9ZZZZ
MEFNSFWNSTPYLVFLFYLLVFFSFELRCRKKRISILAIRYGVVSGLLFFLGGRGFVSSDWISYYPYFQEIPSFEISKTYKIIKFNTETANFESGFNVFSSIIKIISSNYFIWIFVSTAIDIFIIDYFLAKYSRYYALGFILFFVFNGVLMEMNIYRNMKSIGLFFLSLQYVHKHRILSYFILNLLGMAFHTSSVIYLLLYPLWNSKFLVKLMLPIFIVGNILFLFHVKYIAQFFFVIQGDWLLGLQKYLIYIHNPEQYSLSIGYIERIITYVLIYKDLPQLLLNRKNIVYINAYILYFISFFYFTEISVIVQRLTILFVFSYWILYPQLLNLIQNKKLKIICYCCLFIFCSFKVLITHQGFINKYENIFFQPSLYEERLSWYQRMGRW